jgi:hypothetical protein
MNFKGTEYELFSGFVFLESSVVGFCGNGSEHSSSLAAGS